MGTSIARAIIRRILLINLSQKTPSDEQKITGSVATMI
jgi:hypothetical protein